MGWLTAELLACTWVSMEHNGCFKIFVLKFLLSPHLIYQKFDKIKIISEPFNKYPQTMSSVLPHIFTQFLIDVFRQIHIFSSLRAISAAFSRSCQPPASVLVAIGSTFFSPVSPHLLFMPYLLLFYYIYWYNNTYRLNSWYGFLFNSSSSCARSCSFACFMLMFFRLVMFFSLHLWSA